MKISGSSYTYEAIAFVTGFGLLTYELIASRLLAPSIGSSIYVWTSVIGVIIAALSVGYKVGGQLADRRVQPLDVAWLLLVSAALVAITSIMATETIRLVLRLTSDPRWQGFLAALFLFAPASVVIGMISPYLARLKTSSVSTTGTAVASLSTLNAVGSIVGTFSTGFIFMAYMGSKETLALVCVLLVMSSWLIQPKVDWPRRTILALVVLVLVLLSLPSSKLRGLVATVDTPTATYNIIDANYQDQPTRLLIAGPGGYQSGVRTSGDRELVFGYTQAMAEVTRLAPKKKNILVLGGGAYTLPEYLARQYPQSSIDVVELDGQLPIISEQYFNYQPQPNIRNYVQDARIFINNNTKQYDVILMDVFSDSAIPFSLTTLEFASALKRSTAPNGVVAVNTHGATSPQCVGLLGGMYSTLKSPYQFSKLLPVQSADLNVHQNLVLALSSQPLEYLGDDWQEVSLPEQRFFSDNFAPTEYLKSRCTKA